MAQLAAGDLSAMVSLVRDFGGSIAAVVRRHLRDFGQFGLADDRAVVDELVQEAALVLVDRAAAWSPDGALPWTWADRAIRHAVAAHLGNPAVTFDPEVHDVAADLTGAGGPEVPGQPSDELEDLARLAERDPRIALLVEAVRTVGSPRDQQVLWQYRIQLANGDPSPANTVAELFDLRPANVRQIHCRMRRGLRDLVTTDDRYHALRGDGWWAA